MRTGDAAPDVSTPEKFCAALLAAKSIARGDPAGGGTAGVYLEGLFEKLGILEAVAAKSVLRVGGFNVMSEVAAGRADFGLTQSTEIGSVEGVRIGAWLPESLQVTTQYALGARAGPRSERSAKFLEFIASPQGEAIFRAAGFAPA